MRWRNWVAKFWMLSVSPSRKRVWRPCTERGSSWKELGCFVVVPCNYMGRIKKGAEILRPLKRPLPPSSSLYRSLRPLLALSSYPAARLINFHDLAEHPMHQTAGLGRNSCCSSGQSCYLAGRTGCGSGKWCLQWFFPCAHSAHPGFLHGFRHR